MNEYRIIEKMATGSFGVIFKVRRVIDNNIFVMKRIPLTDLNEEQRQDAAQEIRVMRRLHHPFIVSQRDAFIFNNDSLCIVMDYYDGGDLDLLIARQREKDIYISLDCVMTWFAGICFAIHYLHTCGIVHRDLKTHNIFLDIQSNEVAVGDFGVAEFINTANSSSSLSNASQQLFTKRRGSEIRGSNGGCSMNSRSRSRCGASISGDDIHNNNNNNNNNNSDDDNNNDDNLSNGIFGGAVRGTLLYMAPEVLETGVCSPSSDIWSLGCILYELLTLRHPFESKDIAKLMIRVMGGVRHPLPAHYSNDIIHLVDNMLALEATRRPSCSDILQNPAVAPFALKLISKRILREGRESLAERTWAAQLKSLGLQEEKKYNNNNNNNNNRESEDGKLPAVLLPSQERAMAEKVVGQLRASNYNNSSSPNYNYNYNNSSSSPHTFMTNGDSCPLPPLPNSPTPPSKRRESSSFVLDEAAGNKYKEEISIRNESKSNSPHRTLQQEPGNVEDMRDKPLACIEEEVKRYRQLVQSEMRAQKQEKDAASLRKNFGIDTAATAQYYKSQIHFPESINSANLDSNPLHYPLVSNSTPRSRSTAGKGNILNNNNYNNNNYNINNSNISSNSSGGVGVGVNSTSCGSLESSLAIRRRQRMDAAIQILGENVFFNVYNYYKSVYVAQRDTALVMQMVPDRLHWHVLPMIEEVVVIDRLLERVTGGVPS